MRFSEKLSQTLKDRVRWTDKERGRDREMQKNVCHADREKREKLNVTEKEIDRKIS